MCFILDQLAYKFELPLSLSLLYLTLINPYKTMSAFEIHSLRKIVIKYYMEEYFGIDVQMKVIDFEFFLNLYN
jgi:hypothetical protein